MTHNDLSENVKAFRYFMQKSLLPDTTLAKLGVVLGGISVLALMQHALKFGFSDAVEVVVDWYDTFLEVSLGWMQGPLQRLMEWILSSLEIDVDLKPHWKHIFVIANVYFIRNAFTYTKPDANGKHTRDWLPTALVAALSIPTSLLIAGASGTIAASDARSNFLIAFIPLTGFFIYDIVERFCTVLAIPPVGAYKKFDLTRSQALQKYCYWALERFVATSCLSLLLVVCIALYSPPADIEYGVVVFLVCTCLLAIYWISGRASLGYRYSKGAHADPLFVGLMKYSGTTRLGAMMLGTLIWGSIFTLLNAGLGLVGL